MATINPGCDRRCASRYVRFGTAKSGTVNAGVLSQYLNTVLSAYISSTPTVTSLCNYIIERYYDAYIPMNDEDMAGNAMAIPLINNDAVSTVSIQAPTGSEFYMDSRRFLATFARITGRYRYILEATQALCDQALGENTVMETTEDTGTQTTERESNDATGGTDKTAQSGSDVTELSGNDVVAQSGSDTVTGTESGTDTVTSSKTTTYGRTDTTEETGTLAGDASEQVSRVAGFDAFGGNTARTTSETEDVTTRGTKTVTAAEGEDTVAGTESVSHSTTNEQSTAYGKTDTTTYGRTDTTTYGKTDTTTYGKTATHKSSDTRTDNLTHTVTRWDGRTLEAALSENLTLKSQLQRYTDALGVMFVSPENIRYWSCDGKLHDEMYIPII